MRKKPITLPLITDASVIMSSSPGLHGADAPEIATVQLNTLGGDIYMLPLTVKSATDLLAVLSLWEPAMKVIKSGVMPEDRKLDN